MTTNSRSQSILHTLAALSSASVLLVSGCDMELETAERSFASDDDSSWRSAESPCKVHFLGVQEKVTPSSGEVNKEVIESASWSPQDGIDPGGHSSIEAGADGTIEPGYLGRYPDHSWVGGAALTTQQGIMQHWGALAGDTTGYGASTVFEPKIKVVCEEGSGVTKEDIKVRMLMHYRGDMYLGTKNKAFLWGSHALAKAHLGVVGGFKRYNDADGEGTRILALSQNYLRIMDKAPFNIEDAVKKLLLLADVAKKLGLDIAKVPAMNLNSELLIGDATEVSFTSDDDYDPILTGEHEHVVLGADDKKEDYYNFNENQRASSGESRLPVEVTNTWGFGDNEGNIEPNQPFTIDFHTEVVMETEVTGAAESYAKLGSEFVLAVVVEFPGDCGKDYAGLLASGVTNPTPLSSYNTARGFALMASQAESFLERINLPSALANDASAAVRRVHDTRVPNTKPGGNFIVTGFGNHQIGN